MEKSRKEFLLEMDVILGEFFSESGYPAELVEHTTKMIHHVMPDHIEASMPLLFPKFCKILKPNITKEETQQALLLGWIYQLFSSYHIFRDDYMDDGNLRNGQPSWSKIHNHSKIRVVPDFTIMHSIILFTLRKKFSHLPSIYLQALYLFLDCDNLVSKGLRLEKHQLIENLRHGQITLDSFNMETYKLIFALQYSVIYYLPLALSMTLSGYQMDEHRELYQTVERICGDHAVFMKVLDDYYEIFNPSCKIDTESSDADIREGQFTWLFFMAKENCKSYDQVNYLLNHYGQDNDESVANIIELFEKIGIHDAFRNYREETYDNTITEINSSFVDNIEVRDMIKWFFDRCMKHYNE